MKHFETVLRCLTSLFLVGIMGCTKHPDASTVPVTPPFTSVKSSAKAIKLFQFNSLSPVVTADIDTLARTIKMKLSPGTDPSSLSPTIIISDKALISPSSGTPLNFSTPQTYTVTAEDSTKANYVASLVRPAATVKDVPAPPKYLCIYYGFPSLVNGSNGNLNTAVNVFKNFDIIVFADALREANHSDHNNTVSIMAMLKAQKPAIKIYGYIDVGVFATGQPWIHNYSEAQLIQYINDWKSMGATGVFGDDFGSDYQVNRVRQNVFINEAHNKGLSVFANSWSVNDALGGTDCKLDSTDFYLMESFLVSNGAYTSLQANIEKANLAYYYMKTKKVGIACLARPQTINATSNFTDQYKMCWNATAMYNFDAFQFTDANQSASNNLLFYYANPSASYGTSWADFDWVRKISTTRYERTTNTTTFYISGDGSTNGTGGH